MTTILEALSSSREKLVSIYDMKPGQPFRWHIDPMNLVVPL